MALCIECGRGLSCSELDIQEVDLIRMLDNATAATRFPHLWLKMWYKIRYITLLQEKRLPAGAPEAFDFLTT
jgi:hypothetical protein